MRNKENKGWVDGRQGRMRQKGSLLQRLLAGVLSLILLLFSPLQASAATATVNGLINMGNVYSHIATSLKIFPSVTARWKRQIRYD